MPLASLPLTSGFYQSDSLPLSAQECLNLYVNIPQAPGLNDRSLFATPGLAQVVTSGTDAADANRGAWVMGGIPYFVNGDTLYSMSSGGTLTSRGTITGSGPVWMCDNGAQLCILVPGGTGYIYTAATTTLTTISDTDFDASGNPIAVTFVDSYFVFTTDQDKFIISASNDGLTYDALDFGSAESSPDAALVPVVFKNQLFIVGATTCESFINVGGTAFPFERSGLFLEQGTTAPLSVVVTPESFTFIGGRKNETSAVWSLQGNSTVKISTLAIDDLLQDLTPTQLEDVRGWSYAQGGHYFIGFTLPTTTIVYDLTTQLWHERRSRYTDTDTSIVEITYRATCIVAAYGNIYVGDALDGRIGLMSLNTYTEYTETIFRRFSTQPFQDTMKPFFVPYLELTTESGVGNLAEEEPQVRMEKSPNGGKTWTYERSRSMGAIGRYDARQIWRRLGRSARFDVYRFTTSAPVKVAFLALTADIQVTM